MNKRYVVKYRRRREGKTNYAKRIKILSSDVPVVRFRKGSKNISAQITSFDPKGDKILSFANSSELKKYGWNLSTSSIPAAYLTGILLAKKNEKKKLGKLIIDFGIKKPTKGSACYAFLKGAVEGGLDIIHTPKSLPSEDRILGKHISSFFGKEHQKEQFSKTPEAKNIEKIVPEVKNKIIKS